MPKERELGRFGKCPYCGSLALFKAGLKWHSSNNGSNVYAKQIFKCMDCKKRTQNPIKIETSPIN